MYSIILNPFPSGGSILHDPTKNIFVSAPKLVMEDNCAGSLEFDIPPDHALINDVKRLQCIVSVYRDGTEIWCGRPVEENTSFFGVKHVYCEGLLSALHDSVQPQAEYHDQSVSTWLGKLLGKHNSQISPTYRWRPYFDIGIVTVEDNLYRYTNYETTLQCINEKLISRIGGHLRMRRNNTSSQGYRYYLDYLKDYPKTSQQTIRFGQNLLDYAKNFDSSDFCTVLLPLGARLEGESGIDALEKYLDVASVNGGSLYVQNNALVNLYGKITKVVKWDDVTISSNLLSKARQYLNEMQYDNMQLEIKAVDFHLADPGVEAIDLLDEIRVVSEPHGLDRYFPVTKMEIPLDDPANMVLTLGNVVKTSLTSQNNSRMEQIKADIEAKTPASTVLKQAEARATQLITTGELGGNVVVLPNELYIADNTDITKAKKLWRWNIQGLGYSSNGRNGPFGLAMTMDGRINASYILTGTMYADRIKGGTLTLGGLNNTSGIMVVKDASGIIIGQWDSSGISIKRGTFSTESGGKKITLASGQMQILWGEEEIGNIGTNKIQGTQNQGLVFDLDPTGEYMAWAAKASNSESTYNIKLLYANKDIYNASNKKIYEAGMLTAGCPLNMNYYPFKNWKWTDADGSEISGSSTDMHVTNGSNNYVIHFYRGICTGWDWA